MGFPAPHRPLSLAMPSSWDRAPGSCCPVSPEPFPLDHPSNRERLPCVSFSSCAVIPGDVISEAILAT